MQDGGPQNNVQEEREKKVIIIFANPVFFPSFPFPHRENESPFVAADRVWGVNQGHFS